MALNSIWNNRSRGILSCVLLAISVFFHKLSDKFCTFLFRCNVRECGRGVYISRGIIYRYPGAISLGSNVFIGKDVALTSENLPESSLLIEDEVSIGDDCDIDFTGGVSIARGAHLAHRVIILSHDHGYDYKNEPKGKSLSIGENAFVGSDAVILFNCSSIGKNAVVGTCSVVTKDVPDNAIVAGNPARIIKYRDDL